MAAFHQVRTQSSSARRLLPSRPVPSTTATRHFNTTRQPTAIRNNFFCQAHITQAQPSKLPPTHLAARHMPNASELHSRAPKLHRRAQWQRSAAAGDIPGAGGLQPVPAVPTPTFKTGTIQKVPSADQCKVVEAVFWAPACGDVKAAIVFIHGFSQLPGAYYKYMESLAGLGVFVLAPTTLEGALKGPRVLQTNLAAASSTCVDALVNKGLRNRLASLTKCQSLGTPVDLPLGLMGHSVGGGLTFHLASRYNTPTKPNTIKALIALAPLPDLTDAKPGEPGYNFKPKTVINAHKDVFTNLPMLVMAGEWDPLAKPESIRKDIRDSLRASPRAVGLDFKDGDNAPWLKYGNHVGFQNKIDFGVPLPPALTEVSPRDLAPEISNKAPLNPSAASGTASLLPTLQAIAYSAVGDLYLPGLWKLQETLAGVQIPWDDAPSQVQAESKGKLEAGSPEAEAPLQGWLVKLTVVLKSWRAAGQSIVIVEVALLLVLLLLPLVAVLVAVLGVGLGVLGLGQFVQLPWINLEQRPMAKKTVVDFVKQHLLKE